MNLQDQRALSSLISEMKKMQKEELQSKIRNQIYESIENFRESLYLNAIANAEFCANLCEIFKDLDKIYQSNLKAYLLLEDNSDYRNFSEILDKQFESEIEEKLKIFL